MPNRELNPKALLLVTTVLMAMGCEREADDVPPLVNELVRKQAAQQESLLKQSEQLTDASRKLVESDAESRRELVEFQSTVQSQIEGERRNVDLQRNELERERREIAKHRHRDPLIAAAFIQAATLLIAALPIVLVLLLLRAARDEPDTVPMGELLISELSAEKPLLLPSPLVPRRMEQDRSVSETSEPVETPDGEPPF